MAQDAGVAVTLDTAATEDQTALDAIADLSSDISRMAMSKTPTKLVSVVHADNHSAENALPHLFLGLSRRQSQITTNDWQMKWNVWKAATKLCKNAVARYKLR